VGWYNGQVHQRGDLVEIYYVVSRLAELRALSVRLWFDPPGDIQVEPFDWLPPGLLPPESLNLSRYGRAFRKERFLPRILPAPPERKP
jgi:hypothetical protein